MNVYQREVIHPGDRVSQLARNISFQSHGNCPAVTIVPHEPGNFRGPVGFLWKRHILNLMLRGADDPTNWVMMEEMENDGAGGKPQFFTLLGTPEVFRGLGREIITMTADDFARSGRLPAILANELSVKSVTPENFPLIQALFEGFGQALSEAGLVNITGETAVMKHSITAFCDTDSNEQLVLTWGATCVGLAHRDLLINPSRIQPGMPIVGFSEPGYRCNGGTFFTNIILEKWGNPSEKKFRENPEMLRFVKQLVVPSQSYARTITRIVGWNPDGSVRAPLARIRGIAHITGGGVWGKFGEILPEGVGALLHSMPRPAEVLLEAQKLSIGTKYNLTDWEAYSTLHGGCGMLLVLTNPRDAEIVIREAARDSVSAQIVGETTSSPQGEIVIQSQFLGGKELSSLEP
ncbi:MAG: AIR synthase-related protein [Nanoarchaeota archaeon]|nr:AIR synthase-related protein [Nanoarchaeota archaeon]